MAKITTFDLRALYLASGTYEVTVRAKNPYMIDSPDSIMISYAPPQLFTPVISIEDNNLYISNGGAATFFTIFVNGEAAGTVANADVEPTVFDLMTLGLTPGQYTITVVAEAYGYLNSAASDPVTYIMVTPTLTTPVIQFNEGVLSINDESGKAASFDILVNGQIVQSVTAENTTFDLSTLGLPMGNYKVTVKAKANGYIDSEVSNEITYTVLPRVYSITTALSGCSASSDNVTEISENSTATLRFDLQSGYMFPENISVTGADYTWDNNSGTVTLNNPIGAVNIIITCAEIPQLAPAVVSIDGNELHIRDNEGIATFFNILVDGVAKDSVSKTGGTTTLVYDLTKLELPVGEHTITVIAEAEGYVNSETSTPVVYVVAPPILVTPVIQFNGDVLNITDADGKATSFDILVNGEVVQSVSAENATFDFSTLNLPVGTYSVTVKAKADGYVDSETSSAVTYTVVPRVYGITTTLNGCSASSDNATEISENGTTTLRFELQNGYTFPASINVTGAEYVWDSNIGTVELRNPTGAVSVTIACVEVPKPQLDPAVIELDGDILKIYDMSGLAKSATVFVNGEAVQVVEKSNKEGV